jgi:hypothetical protein
MEMFAMAVSSMPSGSLMEEFAMAVGTLDRLKGTLNGFTESYAETSGAMRPDPELPQFNMTCRRIS